MAKLKYKKLICAEKGINKLVIKEIKKGTRKGKHLLSIVSNSAIAIAERYGWDLKISFQYVSDNTDTIAYNAAVVILRTITDLTDEEVSFIESGLEVVCSNNTPYTDMGRITRGAVLIGNHILEKRKKNII